MHIKSQAMEIFFAFLLGFGDPTYGGKIIKTIPE